MNSKDFGFKRPGQALQHVTGIRHSAFKLPLLATALAALVIIGVLTGLMPRWRQHATLRAATRELSIPSVNVVSPEPSRPTPGPPLPADLKPWLEATLYARASGYVKRRFVDIGSQVAAGELLAEIDTPELNQELTRARAQLAQAEAAQELARITAGRWALLVKTASVSEQENAEKQADFKLKTAAAASSRAEVRRLEELRSFARVTAPFAGTITARNVEVGDLITAGSGKELFHLAQTRRLRAYVRVPQVMARSIHSGQSAEMTLPELPGRTFAARVIRTAGMLSSDSRTLLVQLAVDNSKGEILAGGYAQMRFPQAKMDAALTLPANTVLFRADGPQVGIVEQDGKVALRSVKLGRDFGQTVEIVAGLAPTDRVIVNPADSLASGTIVSIAEPAKPKKGR